MRAFDPREAEALFQFLADTEKKKPGRMFIVTLELSDGGSVTGAVVERMRDAVIIGRVREDNEHITVP
jgi:hypothetical protein